MDSKPKIIISIHATLFAGITAALSLATFAAAADTIAPTQPTATTSTGTNAPSGPVAAVEQLQSKITALATDKELKDDVRKQATDLYQSSLKALTQALADDKQAAEYQDALDNGAARARTIRQATPPAAADIAPQAASLSSKEMQQQLAAKVAALRALNASHDELERQIKDLKEEPVTAATTLATARAELDRMKLATTASPASSVPEVAAAERTLRQVQQLAAAAHVHSHRTPPR